MITVTVRYGLSNELTREFKEGTTVGSVLGDPNIMAALGMGSNVVGKIDGSTMEMNHRLEDGDEMDVEVRANTKATQPALELVAA
jgi:hypothetical protein